MTTPVAAASDTSAVVKDSPSDINKNNDNNKAHSKYLLKDIQININKSSIDGKKSKNKSNRYNIYTPISAPEAFDNDNDDDDPSMMAGASQQLQTVVSNVVQFGKQVGPARLTEFDKVLTDSGVNELFREQEQEHQQQGKGKKPVEKVTKLDQSNYNKKNAEVIVAFQHKNHCNKRGGIRVKRRRGVKTRHGGGGQKRKSSSGLRRRTTIAIAVHKQHQQHPKYRRALQRRKDDKKRVKGGGRGGGGERVVKRQVVDHALDWKMVATVLRKKLPADMVDRLTNIGLEVNNKKSTEKVVNVEKQKAIEEKQDAKARELKVPAVDQKQEHKVHKDNKVQKDEQQRPMVKVVAAAEEAASGKPETEAKKKKNENKDHNKDNNNNNNNDIAAAVKDDWKPVDVDIGANEDIFEVEEHDNDKKNKKKNENKDHNKDDNNNNNDMAAAAKDDWTPMDFDIGANEDVFEVEEHNNGKKTKNENEDHNKDDNNNNNDMAAAAKDDWTPMDFDIGANEDVFDEVEEYNNGKKNKKNEEQDLEKQQDTFGEEDVDANVADNNNGRVVDIRPMAEDDKEDDIDQPVEAEKNEDKMKQTQEEKDTFEPQSHVVKGFNAAAEEDKKKQSNNDKSGGGGGGGDAKDKTPTPTPVPAPSNNSNNTKIGASPPTTKPDDQRPAVVGPSAGGPPPSASNGTKAVAGGGNAYGTVPMFGPAQLDLGSAAATTKSRADYGWFTLIFVVAFTIWW
ncbi:hypothetical protein BG004_007923 [Podila humilis]|nr:hypothetical protein BG004_007923 [Podila humilis]